MPLDKLISKMGFSPKWLPFGLVRLHSFRGCIKSDFVFSKTYNLKVQKLLKPLNPLKGT